MAVRRFRRAVDAEGSAPWLQLVCFPHAGAGSGLFRAWPQQLPKGVEVVCPILPGRDARAGEAPLIDMAILAGDVADQLEGLLKAPYAIYGHSLGAFIAFDLTHELARRGAPGPMRLFASGQRGPSLPYPAAPNYLLEDQALLDAVRRRHNAIPEAVLADLGMRAYLVRLLRADFTLVEAYRYVATLPLDCPITVLGGRDDPMITRAQLDLWARETRAGCEVVTIAGGHFYPQTHAAETLAAISARLGSPAAPD